MKRTVKILLAAAIIFSFQFSFLNSAQAQITCKEVNHESCKPGNDGAAKVTIPTKLAPYCSVEWTGPDGKKRSGAQISGLKAGAYSVVVKATPCDKVIFQDVVLVQKDADCRIYAGISVSSQPVPCNVQPTATLTASAWGGTPPYKYTWKTKTVSGSGTYGVTVTDSNGFVGSAKVSVSLKKTKCPEDPNEIDGPVGYGEEHLVSTNEKMRYTILYENSPEFASAPASLVNITYPIPPEQNINSVRLSDFGFGSFVFNVPSNTTAYTQRLDVSDSLGVWVDVTAGIDMTKKQVFWNLQSVDPATGFEPASADLGFLLVNDSLHHGEGYVSFSIAPKDNVTSGDTVGAEATIIFNENTAIATNVWTNTFDAIAPTSDLHAEIEADDSTACHFTFSAHDDLSGIDNVELLVSLNGDAYKSLGYFALTDTAHYTLEDGYVYRFISRATDNVGNQETMKSQPDTLINNNTAPVDILLSDNSFEENVATGTLVGTLTSIDNDITKPFVYELVEGEGDDDNSSFYIEGNGLYTGATYACSGRFDYSVRIRTTDITGLSFEKDFDLKSIQQNFPYNRSSNESICQGSSYQFGNRYLIADGTYTDSLTTVMGCDSIVTVNLTVHPTSHTTAAESSCEYQPFTWTGHNKTYDSLAAGQHYLYDTLYTTMGCDSTFMLALTVHANSSSSATQDVCDSYSFGGQQLVVSGQYADTLTNAAGCDSIATLNLTIRYSNSGIDTVTDCDSYTWHGMTYTGGGTNVATYTTTNAAGCDSVVTLNLTLHYSSTGSETQNVCDNYIWHDTTYTASGTHEYHTTNAVGCDSVATLYLTVRHSSSDSETQNVCDNYTFGGQQLVVSGQYADTLTNAVGCDSVATLNLTVRYSSTGDTAADACDSYTWHGTTYTVGGPFVYQTTNSAGCDSVVTLNLTLRYSSTGTDIQTACDSYTFGGQQLVVSGQYADTLTNAAGCDSVATLNLTLHYSNTGTDIQTACDSYLWHGTTYTASNNTATYTTTNAAGCDSVTTLNLTLHYSNTGSDVQSACDSYLWHGTTYTASNNTATYTTTNVAGCDSVITLNLTIRYSSTSDTAAIACDSYTWHNTTYTAGGMHQYQTTNAVDCDSVVTLNLTLHYSNTGSEVQSACDSYTWHDTTFTASGTHQYQTTNAAGCDSVATLYLTVRYSSSGSETQDVCDSYTWHGTTYTTSGTHEYQTTNAVGCDSVATLNLTIRYSSTSDTAAVACDSYTWHGTTYTVGGTHQYQTTNAAGCDSVVTLNLTLGHSVTVYDSLSLTPTEIPYDYHGNTVNAAGDYTFDGTTTEGCDSTTLLHVEVITVGLDITDPLAELKVYPNPTHGTLTIDAEDVLTVEAFDLAGRKVVTLDGVKTFDISHLPSGTYTLRIKTERGETVRRIVKN